MTSALVQETETVYQSVCLLFQQWRPWEPPQTNMEQEEVSANTAREPHGELRNYAEALKRPDAQEWERAKREEMNNHTENKTWSLVTRPENCNVIGSRWVFWLKYNTDGTIERYKVRLLAKGYNQ